MHLAKPVDPDELVVATATLIGPVIQLVEGVPS
jgi:hypothetical protein